MARRRFFVDEVSAGRAAIHGRQARHLCTVLRARAGQQYELSDGRKLYLGRVELARPSRVDFAIERELEAAEPAGVTLLAAIFKFDRLEWMIEKAAELGVARVTPVIAARTAPALAGAAARRVARWRRLVEEASQQARRIAPPEIADPQPFDHAVSAAPAGRRVMLDENPQAPRRKLAGASVLLTGPEGGWTSGERRLAREAGFEAVSLGPLVLRAETAAIVALGAVMLARDPDDLTL